MQNALSQFRLLAASPIGFLAIGCLILVGCSKSAPLAAGPSKKPVPEITAETIEVGYGVWPRLARSQGELRADETVAVGMRVAGRVAEVHVELGDFVKQGQPLVTLDPSEFKLMVAQAEAQLAQARSAVGLAPKHRWKVWWPRIHLLFDKNAWCGMNRRRRWTALSNCVNKMQSRKANMT